MKTLISQFQNRPTLITPPVFQAEFMRLVESSERLDKLEARRGDGLQEMASEADLEKWLADWCPAWVFEKPKTEKGICTVPIKGMVTRGASTIERIWYGLCDVDRVQNWLRAAAADDNVRVIVLDINSPGGTVSQVMETAALVAEIAKTKTVIAWVDELCASAAYWIASQASLIICAPSADLGSIGVYLQVWDVTGWYESFGVKIETIKAGTLKAIGAPGSTLSDEQRAYLQQGVTELHNDFRAQVRAGRETPIEDSSMEGQTFMGSDAVRVGLADSVATYQDVTELAAEIVERHKK